MEYVLLIDDNDATALVACPDPGTASRVAAAATMTDGDVSAYRVPGWAITDHEAVAAILRDGGQIEDVAAAQLPTAAREAV